MKKIGLLSIVSVFMCSNLFANSNDLGVFCKFRQHNAFFYTAAATHKRVAVKEDGKYSDYVYYFNVERYHDGKGKWDGDYLDMSNVNTHKITIYSTKGSEPSYTRYGGDYKITYSPEKVFYSIPNKIKGRRLKLSSMYCYLVKEGYVDDFLDLIEIFD